MKPSGDLAGVSRPSVPLRGTIFDLGGTLVHNHPEPELERERRQCVTIARLAADELGCRIPDVLAERLVELRIDSGHQTQRDLIERRARDTIAGGLREAGLTANSAFLDRAEQLLFAPDRGRPLYPGARELLETLRGHALRIGLISNWSSHWIVTDIVRCAGIDEFFAPLVSSASFGRVKPHASIFEHVLQIWGLVPADVVMVGDTLGTDILGATRIGMRSILINVEPNSANAEVESAIHPTYRARHLLEIPALLGLE